MVAVFKQEDDFIEGIEKDTETDPFTKIRRAVFKDKRLNDKLLGVLTYLLDMPADWKVRMREIANRFDLNICTAKERLSQLVKHGYAVKKVVRKGKNGRFSHNLWYIRNKPNNIIDLTATVSEFPSWKTCTLTKKDLTKKDKQSITKLGSTNTCARENQVSVLPQQPGGRGLFKKSWIGNGNNATGGYRMNNGPKDLRTVLGDVTRKTAEHSQPSQSTGVPSTPEALAALIGDKVSVACLKVWIHKHGHDAVQRYVTTLAEKLKTQDFDVNSVFPTGGLPQGHPTPKTSPEPQKQASRASYTPTGDSKPDRESRSTSSAPVGNSNNYPSVGAQRDYESVVRECMWTPEENQSFYRRATRETREAVLADIRAKWSPFDHHCKQWKIDPLSDEFVHSHLFRTVSEILNQCRVLSTWQAIRSRQWYKD